MFYRSEETPCKIQLNINYKDIFQTRWFPTWFLQSIPLLTLMNTTQEHTKSTDLADNWQNEETVFKNIPEDGIPEGISFVIILNF